MGLSVENNLKKDLEWAVEIGCGDHGLRCGRGWDMARVCVCAPQVCVH